MAQNYPQLPLVQVPMQNLPPLQSAQQEKSQLPDFINNPNIDINTKKRLLNEYNNVQPYEVSKEYIPPTGIMQQPIVNVSPQAIAGAQGKGVNWGGVLGTIGSYLNAAGQGMAGASNPTEGLANAMTGVNKNMQNIRNYDTMLPYYKEMGYDVSRLDPRRGGAGVGSSPESMIDLQSKLAERNYLNEYRQSLAEARLQAGRTKEISVKNLMMISPAFKQYVESQYDFSNGQNAKILDTVLPSTMVQTWMPAKQVNMNYTGGLNSSKNVKVNNTYNGAGGKSKPKLMY